jgi:hypothetical protein
MQEFAAASCAAPKRKEYAAGRSPRAAKKSRGVNSHEQ